MQTLPILISVVIRNKNQAEALEFLLLNLTTRYINDIEEIIVIDNLSTDRSEEVCKKYHAKFEVIENFSYGGSANFAAAKASQPYVVIFSAHSYPVSPNFFTCIKSLFDSDNKLAGLRCLHSHNDFTNYILGISSKEDPNKSGLIFSGSAFRKSVWKENHFNDSVPTFEDKEWTLRLIEKGYKIEFAPVIFHYHIKRNREQAYFRFKKNIEGDYLIWQKGFTYKNAIFGLIGSIIRALSNFFMDLWYALKRFAYQIKFLLHPPGDIK